MRRFAFLAALLLCVAPAGAHDTKGPHGGRVADLGPYHAELAGKDTNVDVFVTDEKDKPIAMAGYKGVAILVVRGKSERIELAPVGDNKLSGTAGVPVPSNAKGAVRITGPDGKAHQAKF
jgi:hypothetical protein